jgi:hypothetical protein
MHAPAPRTDPPRCYCGEICNLGKLDAHARAMLKGPLIPPSAPAELGNDSATQDGPACLLIRSHLLSDNHFLSPSSRGIVPSDKPIQSLQHRIPPLLPASQQLVKMPPSQGHCRDIIERPNLQIPRLTPQQVSVFPHAHLYTIIPRHWQH